MPPTISDFRAISTGTHNVGDVLLDETTGGLKKVNNFVSRWRVERNNTVSSARENIAVRKALYNALMTDGRVSAPVMSAIRNQLLGENGVRALKRDEVAVYLAAADADDATGMVERVKELRERKIGAAGDKPTALKSKSDVAMQLSVNEKLDLARMYLQRARQDVEHFMVAKKRGQPVDEILKDVYNDFFKAYSGLALQNAPNDRKRKEWEDAIKEHADIFRTKLANGTFQCGDHEEMAEYASWVLKDIGLNGYPSSKFNREVKAPLEAVFSLYMDELAPSTVDVVIQTVEALGENASIPDEAMAGYLSRKVAGRHYENDNPNSVVTGGMKNFLENIAQQVGEDARNDPRLAGLKTEQRERELMLKFFKQLKADVALEKVKNGQSECVLALADTVSQWGNAFGGNVIPEYESSLKGYEYGAKVSLEKIDSEERSCSIALKLKVPVKAVGVGGVDYELKPACKMQTSIEYAISFRLKFDKDLKPEISVDKSVEKIDMPDVIDGERYENVLNENGAIVESKVIPLHPRADSDDESGVAEPLSDVQQNRESANPKSYHNVREGLRMWCQAARHVYTSTLASRMNDANAKPNPALIGELYMEMSAFDNVKDINADCPNAKKLLDKGLDQLARRLVRVFKRHGVDMDPATARYAMQIHFNYLRDYSDDWKKNESKMALTFGEGKLNVTSTATPAHLINGNAKYAKLPGGRKGLNCTTFTGSRAVNAWQSTFEVGDKKFVGMRHGVNCAIKEADLEKRRECNLARAEELFVGAAMSSALVQNAKDGETVTLDMTSVSLLTPDAVRNGAGAIDNERQMLADQTAAWRALQEKYGDGTAGLALSVPTENGGKKMVHVKLDLIAFNFGVNKGAVGHYPSGLVGGWGVSDEINKLGMLLLGERVDKYLSLPVDEGNQFKKNLVRTLFNQVKDILERKDERHDGHNAYKVPMRINVLTSLMNGIPAWNCKSGKDRTGALEVWTQLLYQKIMSGQGVPDPNDPPTEEDIENFKMLSGQGNNFTIQKANTGFGGYKTKDVDSFEEILGGKEALDRYYGASELVNE